MNDKQLYKVFIGMFALNVSVGLFTAYHAHQERKLRIEELRLKGISKEKLNQDEKQ